jgi:MSHA pilin protein MshD
MLGKRSTVRLHQLRASGFSLIELIIGIVVLAIAMLFISAILGPLFVRSIEPWHQVRAAELGNSLMNEILARSFDENSSRGSTLLRCGDAGAQACVATIPNCPANGMSATTEEASRDLYDDVDDFHCLNVNGSAVTTNLNPSLQASYNQYQVQVAVSHAGTSAGLAATQVKRIDVLVTLPNSEVITFTSYKGNW